MSQLPAGPRVRALTAAVAMLAAAAPLPAFAGERQNATAQPQSSSAVPAAPPKLLRRFEAPGRQPGEAPEVFEIYDLGNGAYDIGGTHSSGVVVGERGILVIDTRWRRDFPVLRREIARLSKKPIIYVVGTHYHPDHVEALDLFREAGAKTITQANVPARMLAPPEPNPHTGAPMAPAPIAALPEITYTDRLTLDLGGTKAELIYPGPAHTDGDSIVWVPDKNVIYSGDLVVLTYAPPDIYSGGSIDGLIRSADVIIKLSNDGTRIVTGHSRVMFRAEVVAFRNMLQVSRDRIAAAKAKGMTEDQVVSAHLLADLDAQWTGPGGPIIMSFVRRVYRSLP